MGIENRNLLTRIDIQFGNFQNIDQNYFIWNKTNRNQWLKGKEIYVGVLKTELWLTRIEIAKFKNKAQSRTDLITLSDSSEEIEKPNDKKLSISQSLDKKESH